MLMRVASCVYHPIGFLSRCFALFFKIRRQDFLTTARNLLVTVGLRLPSAVWAQAQWSFVLMVSVDIRRYLSLGILWETRRTPRGCSRFAVRLAHLKC